MKPWTARAVAGNLGWLAAAGAQAHTGHGVDGLAAGLVHPFMGPDHLLAMLAVGLWSAAVLPAGRRWWGPACFVGLLLVGALSAIAGLSMPGIEAGVALSVVLLGGLLLARRRVSPLLGMALIGGAALMHGHAHGSELAHGGSFAAYAAGFMLGSTLLHGAGLAAGTWLQRSETGRQPLRMRIWRERIWQLGAGLIGASGLAMLATRL